MADVPRLTAAVSNAGGHVWGKVATLPLVPAVVDAVAPVPVIAADGIGDARGIAAVLTLGAIPRTARSATQQPGRGRPQAALQTGSGQEKAT